MGSSGKYRGKIGHAIGRNVISELRSFSLPQKTLVVKNNRRHCVYLLKTSFLAFLLQSNDFASLQFIASPIRIYLDW